VRHNSDQKSPLNSLFDQYLVILLAEGIVTQEIPNHLADALDCRMHRLGAGIRIHGAWAEPHMRHVKYNDEPNVIQL
jgi:hypothetical protein